jgi:hypothetical protein
MYWCFERWSGVEGILQIYFHRLDDILEFYISWRETFMLKKKEQRHFKDGLKSCVENLAEMEGKHFGKCGIPGGLKSGGSDLWGLLYLIFQADLLWNITGWWLKNLPLSFIVYIPVIYPSYPNFS